MVDQKFPDPDEVSSQLYRLVELSRMARQSESAAALQFLLVNQTFQIANYLLGVLWVENEGVISQSGITKLERTAPYVQWLSKVCAKLSSEQEAVRVTPNMLEANDLEEWRQSLPASAVWFPMSESGEVVAGLVLARQDPWEDHEIAILVEWIDVWKHAWIKLHAPTARGELYKVANKLIALLPTTERLKSECSHFLSGLKFFWVQTVSKPECWPIELKKLLNGIRCRINGLVSQAKELGVSGVSDAIKKEVVSIWRNKRRRAQWLITIVLLFPVRLSVLAPAELVPEKPAIIRVPIEGVVDEFFVTPNQHVSEGQLLFRLDLTTLTSRFNVAQQETQIAASEYRQSSLQSLTDAKSRTQLVPQEGKALERRVEAEYLKDLIAKAQIKSPRDGIVLFDDPSEWIGKPVAAGEKVMVVSKEGDVEIEAWVPVNDAISFPKEAPVTLYLNASPLSPIDGKLRFIGHEALQRPDGSYAYRVRASLKSNEDAPHVGLKGTAKLSGQYVPLIYWILRKPLGTVRQFFGI